MRGSARGGSVGGHGAPRGARCGATRMVDWRTGMRGQARDSARVIGEQREARCWPGACWREGYAWHARRCPPALGLGGGWFGG